MDRSDFGFFHELRVRFAETDAQGIVFNGDYLTYFDAALYDYLRSLPFDYRDRPEQTGQDFRIVKIEVEFYKSSVFDEELQVGVRAERLGRTSISWGLGVFLKGDPKLRVYGKVVWVNTDVSTGKSTPLPDDLVGRITGPRPKRRVRPAGKKRGRTLWQGPPPEISRQANRSSYLVWHSLALGGGPS